MRKIRQLVSEHISNSAREKIQKLPPAVASEDNVKVSYAIGDFLKTSNDSMDNLCDIIDRTDDKIEKSIEEALNRTPIGDCEYWRRYYAEKQLMRDFPFEDTFDKDTCKRLYMAMKERIINSYSDIMFATLSLHKLERMMVINGWDFNQDEVKF